MKLSDQSEIKTTATTCSSGNLRRRKTSARTELQTCASDRVVLSSGVSDNNDGFEITSESRSDPILTRQLLGSCAKLVAQIEKAKDAIIGELRETLEANDRLLRLALNEAEALAWQTEYPHLVFPALALEKAQAVAAWHTRQQAIHRTTSVLSLAV